MIRCSWVDVGPLRNVLRAYASRVLEKEAGRDLLPMSLPFRLTHRETELGYPSALSV